MDLYKVQLLKTNLTTTMILSELIKSPCPEKKDCKITNNGVIWLKSNEYGSRVAGKKIIQKKAPKSMISTFSKQYSLTKKLTDNDSYYNPEGNRCINLKLPRCKNRKESVKKLYSINKRKVRARLTNFINTEQGQSAMYFYSLSFPKNIDENIAYSLLNSTLTTLRTAHNVKNYLWIAERQKNGTIHYHLALYHFVKVRIINDVVKKYLKYAIRKQQLQWSITAANNYNGVDIAKDRKTRVPTNFAAADKAKKIAGYLTKYITKSTQKFTRQAWNSSKSLAAISDGICVSVNEVVQLFSSWEISDSACYANDFCMFFKWIDEAPDIYMKLMFNINTQRVAVFQ